MRPQTTSESFEPTVTVGREYLPICVQHGMELWWDDSTPTKRLDQREDSSQFTRFVNARIEGKLSEVAFMLLLEEHFDVRSAVDWRIYGDYQTTDDGDLQYILDDDDERHDLGCFFDIKKTKPWNQWLAIREEIYERYDDTDPIILTKHNIDQDLPVSRWSDCSDWSSVDQNELFRERLLEFASDVFPLHIEFSGTAYPTEFEEFFEEGERLYDLTSGSRIGPELRRPNEAIHVEHLKNTPQRWNRVVSEIIGDNDIDWEPLPVVDPPPR